MKGWYRRRDTTGLAEIEVRSGRREAPNEVRRIAHGLAAHCQTHGMVASQWIFRTIEATLTDDSAAPPALLRLLVVPSLTVADVADAEQAVRTAGRPARAREALGNRVQTDARLSLLDSFLRRRVTTVPDYLHRLGVLQLIHAFRERSSVQTTTALPKMAFGTASLGQARMNSVNTKPGSRTQPRTGVRHAR